MSIFVSLLTAGTNNHEETSENANAVATDFVSKGVIGAITNTSGVAPSTGAFAVNAQDTPDRTVKVSSGVVYVQGTPTSQNSQTLRVRMSADQNVTISANSSGSTKFDWVYVKLDATKMATPGVNADDVATLVTSRSSSSSADNGTPPTYGYPVGVVTVANGAISISNASIADIRVLARSVQDGANTTSTLAANSVDGTKLSTSAIKLASIVSSTSQSSISTTPVILTGLTTTVTVPAGGRSVRVDLLVPNMKSSAISAWTLYIYNSATVTGSAVASAKILQGVTAANCGGYVFFEHTPSAGSQSYCAAISVDTGSGSTVLTSIEAARFSVKVV